MKILRLVAVGALVSGCSNLVVLRGSSSDFLKRKATTVTLSSPVATVQPVLDELFYQRGFRPSMTHPVSTGTVIIYKGPRPVPPELAAYGIQLGSWFAARIGSGQLPNTTDVTLIGKPMVGMSELCSEHDKLLADIQYTCIDTKMPPDWVGTNYVSGRDETEVVSWVLNGLYERLKR